MQKNFHSIPEDLFAIITAGVFIALGVYLLKFAGFLTGGTAGIALILEQLLPFSFGQIFFAINLPFYYLAWTRMGARFTVNTFVSVLLVSAMTDLLPYLIVLQQLNPFFAAIAGGGLIGIGILISFRHVSSVGGLGVLAKYLQDRFGLSAGNFQMGLDVAIVIVGFFMVSPLTLCFSVLAAIVLNLIISVNHKPGRYQIT